MIAEIDGKRFEVENPLLHLGTEPETSTEYYQLNGDGAEYKIKVISFDMLSRTCTLEINGHQKTVKILREIDLMIENMGLNTTRTKKHRTMNSPMPGLVTQIHATTGQHVTKGTPLLILEAMKMENVIAAPHDAVIKEIGVTVGQAVERGFPLVEFE